MNHQNSYHFSKNFLFIIIKHSCTDHVNNNKKKNNKTFLLIMNLTLKLSLGYICIWISFNSINYKTILLCYYFYYIPVMRSLNWWTTPRKMVAGFTLPSILYVTYTNTNPLTLILILIQPACKHFFKSTLDKF